MFYFLFLLALVSGGKTLQPVTPVPIANKTAQHKTILDKVIANPKQFVAEVQNLDPTALRTIINLLHNLLTTSEDRENTLDQAITDAEFAVDSAANDVADADEDLTNKNDAVEAAEKHLKQTTDAENAKIGAAEGALAGAETDEAEASDALADAKADHASKKTEKEEAESMRGGEIDNLNHEQKVIIQVIEILEGLHAKNLGASLIADNWELVGGATLDSGVAKCETGGGCNIITKTEFSRPMEVLWTSKKLPSSGDECVVMDVFPQNNGRHSGYSIGYGWWAHYLGYGADNAQGYQVTEDGDISVNHVYKMKLTDTSVEFYQDDVMFASLDDTRYTSGKIRIGQSCVNWEVSDVTVNEL